MGSLGKDTEYIYITKTERWRFSIGYYYDPASEVSCSIVKQMLKGSQWQDIGESFRRDFEGRFNKFHFQAFKKKFVSNEEYRNQFKP